MHIENLIFQSFTYIFVDLLERRTIVPTEDLKLLRVDDIIFCHYTFLTCYVCQILKKSFCKKKDIIFTYIHIHSHLHSTKVRLLYF